MLVGTHALEAFSFALHDSACHADWYKLVGIGDGPSLEEEGKHTFMYGDLSHHLQPGPSKMHAFTKF